MVDHRLTSTGLLIVGFLSANCFATSSTARTPISAKNDSALRLVGGGSPREGRLEIFHAGSWGTVCDKNFALNSVKVACQSLGFGFVGELLFNFYGPGTGKIWLGNVVCTGNETEIANCSHAPWGQTSYYGYPNFPYNYYNCYHSNDVSLACYDDTTPRNVSSNFRLSGSNETGVGRLEVLYNGTWGAVCRTGFDDVDARVACHSLGFGRYGHSYTNSSDPVYRRDWLSQVACVGYESSLMTCPHNSPWSSVYFCSAPVSGTSYDYVWLVCRDDDKPDEDSLQVRLVDDRTHYYYPSTTKPRPGNITEGRLEVKHSGVWGTVCNIGFDDHDAKVACFSLGFGHVGYVSRTLRIGADKIWLDDVGCIGTETSLAECRHSPWGLHHSSCYHGNDVWITCINVTNELRLVGGYDSREGRLQVKHNGVWGSVCNDAFNDTDAQVACYTLGYGYVGRTLHEPFGSSNSSTYWLDGVQCVGTETSLFDCRHIGWGVSDCYNYEDVSISCRDNDTTTVATLGDSTRSSAFTTTTTTVTATTTTNTYPWASGIIGESTTTTTPRSTSLANQTVIGSLRTTTPSSTLLASQTTSGSPANATPSLTSLPATHNVNGISKDATVLASSTTVVLAVVSSIAILSAGILAILYLRARRELAIYTNASSSLSALFTRQVNRTTTDDNDDCLLTP